MDTSYNPNLWEDNIYEKWEKSGFFNPDNLNLPEDAPNYTIILPPPNITSKLHIGHAFGLSIEDLFIRYHRMNGYRALWIPGTDHAAIATQNVVEKKILAEEKKTRHELGREEFLKRVWLFLEQTQSTILNQTRKMGASIDWGREAFTLDEKRKKAVERMFVDMYQEGVIYKGERIVNWCPRCHSTLADDEVEYKEQKALLYTLKYDKDFPISISTTRPETKLGDTAIAVNPKDKRYAEYIGQTLATNFCGQKLNIKIIADKNVDMDFGTGALGVTPAHSMIDWQMAQKNNLEIIKVIDEDGLIKKEFSKFSGKKAEEARKMIVEELKDNNLVSKEEELSNNLSICYRCNSAIEPLPSKQWFVAVDKKIKRLNNKSLKEKAIEAVKLNKIEFVPEKFSKRYLNWMENLHDWCISRQIWFGHEIPAWYKENQIYVGNQAPSEEGWKQDADTLDTWFSSGMWTFSTLGWPEATQDLQKYHPTQVLETGYDLITLWISRMVMMSFFALNEVPFEKVYLHGMVLDKDGKKMSKTKGNGIDPLDMIKEFGTDALRFSLLVGNSPGNDIRMYPEKVIAGRNLINKLWNISRFILSKNQDFSDNYNKDKLTLSDKWILEKLNNLIGEVSDNLNNYNFSLAGENIKDFTWNNLADWYLEVKKFEKDDEGDKILLFILKNILKLFHPFIPFVTELLWQEIKEDKLLMVSSWPIKDKFSFSSEEKEFEAIKNIISSIRNARFVNKIEPAKKIKAIIKTKNEAILKSQEHLLLNLKTGLEEIIFNPKNIEIDKDNSILISLADTEIYLLGAIDEEKERERRQKKIDNLLKMIALINNKLSNKEFVSKAPEEIIKKEKEKLFDYQKELEKLKQ